MSAPADKSSFNLSEWALRHQALVIYLIVLATVAGILSYMKLPQSEDPPFNFRVMVIRTFWSGASAQQVQEQISDRISRKLQDLPQTDFLQSYSRPGESMIFYTVKDSSTGKEIQDTWYQVRKKVSDVKMMLPPETQGPFFNDEFGDVCTNIFTLEGDGYTPAQLHDYADQIRTVLLGVPGVVKVDYFGDPTQRIHVEIDNTKLAHLQISPKHLADAIRTQNSVQASGMLATSDDRIFVRPTGQFQTVQQLSDTLIQVNGKSFHLGDIANITRGYDDPVVSAMRLQGKPALGIGITMRPGGDVIELGTELDKARTTLQNQIPAGLTLTEVASMPHTVSGAVNEFLRSLAEAVIIVLAVSLVSLGLRTGMIVVISIPVVLAVTALFMHLFDIGLDRVSLGTLVLALGLLVDDAIISIEMMVVKLEQGWDKVSSAAFAYTSAAFPMLTGTLVTVAGFLPIALARSGTGEYTRSIFQVSAIALIASWFAAVVLIPVLGFHLLPEKKLQPQHAQQGHDNDAYQTAFYRRFHAWISWCVERRFIVILITVALFAVSMAAFTQIPKQFFPTSDRPDLLVDLRLSEGASFAATLRETQKLEALIKERSEIDHTLSYVGTGSPRFYLPLDQQLDQANFAQLVITTKSVEDREKLATWLDTTLHQQLPNVRSRISRLENGPPVGFPVQFRVSGDDIAKVRNIAIKLAATMREEPRAANVQFDWDEPSERSLRFEVDQKRARDLGVTSEDVSNFLVMSLDGVTVTQFRERDKLIAVDLRAPPPQRVDPTRIETLSMPTDHGAVPVNALGTFKPDLDYGVIWERNRLPAITVRADVVTGAQGIDVTQAIDKTLGGLRAGLPVGYRIEIGGPVEANAKAQLSINEQLPIMVIVVLTLLMIQLQSVSRVLIVVLTAPLGMVGVVASLLIFRQPFGFVAMLGVIAMFGIIMRNSVILMDQIEQNIQRGHRRFDAIVQATTHRFRPIVLTAAAAVLALIPLLHSNFFGPMATSLMGGITTATILTLFFLPAIYAAWFKVQVNETEGAQP